MVLVGRVSFLLWFVVIHRALTDDLLLTNFCRNNFALFLKA